MKAFASILKLCGLVSLLSPFPAAVLAGCPTPCGCNPCPTVSTGSMIIGALRWPDFPAPLEVYKYCCPNTIDTFTGEEVRDVFGVWVEGLSDQDLIFPRERYHDEHCHCQIDYKPGQLVGDSVTVTWSTSFTPYTPGTYTLTANLANTSVATGSPGGWTTPPATCATISCPLSVMESRSTSTTISVLGRPSCSYIYEDEALGCMCHDNAGNNAPWPPASSPPSCDLYCISYTPFVISCPSGNCCPPEVKSIPYYLVQTCSWNPFDDDIYCLGDPIDIYNMVAICCEDEDLFI